MCIVFCLIIINISQLKKVQIRIKFVYCYQPFSIYNGAVIGMFDVAVVDGYQIINIQVDSPYMQRFSLFQSFTHFGFPVNFLEFWEKHCEFKISNQVQKGIAALFSIYAICYTRTINFFNSCLSLVALILFLASVSCVQLKWLTTFLELL